MGRKVLVLNADYSAISLCTVSKAFILVYLRKAELVASNSNLKLRSVTRSFPYPSVIRLSQYVNVPYKSVELSRGNIFKRDKHQCVYCGNKEDLTLDHVMPKSRGGKTSWDNLVAACRKCNARKGDYTPEEAFMLMSHQPYKPTFLSFLRDSNGTVDNEWKPFLGIVN
ncbi:MAG: HNH endonuclease [Spirosomataceae bacterium]